MMDGSDIAIQSGLTSAAGLIGFFVSKLAVWRKEERAEDAVKAKEKAEHEAQEKLAVAFDLLKDRVTRVESSSTNFDKQLSALMEQIRELRDDQSKALAEHRRYIHDQVSNITTVILKTRERAPREPTET